MSTCVVVANTCLAPAGYLIQGLGYGKGESKRLPRCYNCGEPVCTNCSLRVGRSRLCASCADDFARSVLG